MLRYLTHAFLALVAAAWLAAPAFGGPGVLSETAGAVTPFTVTLNGSDQTPNYALPITLTDTRNGGNANGWNLTITSTQFATSIAPIRTLATNASTIAVAPSVVCTVGPCTNPTNSVTFPVAVPAGSTPPTAVKFYNAANHTGTGVFTITPTVNVTVPGNSFTGTYTSTITLAVVAGP